MSDEDDFVIEDYDLESIISKYVNMLDVPHKDEVLKLCLHYHDKAANK